MSTTNDQPVVIQKTRYADASLIRAQFENTVVEIQEALGEVTIISRREGLLELLTFLRDDPGLNFNFLSDLSAVDLGEFAEPRFAVVYHLYSLPLNHRIRVKVFLAEDAAHLPTISSVWPCAEWHEREAYDMFGINFADHPDLRRILMPYDYEGFPLRKDFPIKGY